MIISKTPLRLSFVGGGSDLSSYYRQEAGAVLSTSINKFIYITINKRFSQGIRLSYSKTEDVPSADEIEHKIVRATLKKLGIESGVEITSIADIPSRGSGLGSSSAFTVGLLQALHAYQGRYRSKHQLAVEACEVEINRCGEPIGKQDQFAAAAGGLNLITFNPDESVTVEPVVTPDGVMRNVEAELLMFYTGIVRSASELLVRQSQTLETDPSKRRTLRRMVELVYMLRAELAAGHSEAVGEILHENWMMKKTLMADISSSAIDMFYDIARKSGARGGKLMGAGGGGFLLFSAPQERHADLIEALSDLRHVSFSFENLGTSIVFYQPTQ
jgi:D-glycero-alpha-D-manno-heptose-7-phosphate kinase